MTQTTQPTEPLPSQEQVFVMSSATVEADAIGEPADMFSWRFKINRPVKPTVDYLIAEAHAIIDRAFREHHAVAMLPLYSGGNDSGCSCHVASLHPRFAGTVYTINTRTGAFRTKLHQRKVCKQFGWSQEVRRSRKPEDKYESFVRMKGLPGPGMHTFIYTRIKARVVEQWVQEHKAPGRPVCLVTGARASESTRRMGTTKEIQKGYLGESGKVSHPYQLWTAPIVNWTSEDKRTYMKHFGIPLNPFSATLGMSLECGCGAFADRADFGGEGDERELLRKYAPDVSKKIDIVERIARESGTHCVWGTRPRDAESSDSEEEELPMLCQSCVARSAVSRYS